MVTYQLIPKSEAERMLREGLARPMTKEEAERFESYLKKQGDNWIRVGTGYVQASALLSQVQSQRARKELEEFERKSRERARKEMEEALKNQELIEKGLHPIYSRVQGKMDFKVENGYIWRRYWLAGGQWGPWEKVKPYIEGAEYTQIPGKGIFSLNEVLQMAKNGTLNTVELLSLPSDWIATIVKNGFLNIMGMTPELKKALLETYDPDEQEKAVQQFQVESENLRNLIYDALKYLNVIARGGQLSDEERMALMRIAEQLGDPTLIPQVWQGMDVLSVLRRLPYPTTPGATVGDALDFWNWLTSGIGSVANAVDQWIANTFNVRQPLDYLVDGVNKLLTVFGFKELTEKDEEWLRDVASLAGIGSYSQTIGSLIGMALGYGLLGKAPTLLSRLGILGKEAMNPAVYNTVSGLSRISGALIGGAIGGQLAEPLSWNAISTKTQATNMLKAIETEKSLQKDREWDEIRTLSMNYDTTIDALRTAYYAGDYRTAVQLLGNAVTVIRQMEETLAQHREHYTELGVYDTLRTMVETYKTVVEGYKATIRGKDPSLAALLNSIAVTRLAAETHEAIDRFRNEHKYIDIEDPELMRAYLTYIDAMKYYPLTLQIDRQIVDTATGGTGLTTAFAYPLPNGSRVDTIRKLVTPSRRQVDEVTVKHYNTYLQPSKDPYYYQAVLTDWTNLGLSRPITAILPDWIKSILLKAPSFYKAGKERGYWYPYEMLALVIIMLLLGSDFTSVLSLFSRLS